MISNITSEQKKETPNRQVPAVRIDTETHPQAGDRVYLYNDPKYIGTLIRPIERTYPPRWTVELDNGGYEAAKVADFSPVTPVSASVSSEKPVSEDETEVRIKQLEEEILALRQENQRLKEELKEAKQTIRRAKDISPLMRISLKRVLRLAGDACMDVKRTVGGWILKMGDKARKFRRLADIWDILAQDDWILSDIFTPDKLIRINEIKPPRPRKRPTPPIKQTMPLVSSDTVQLWRRMGLPKC